MTPTLEAACGRLPLEGAALADRHGRTRSAYLPGIRRAQDRKDH